MVFKDVRDSSGVRDNFSSDGDEGLRISDHDMVFWMGDLNYRIEGLPNDIIKTRLLSEQGIESLKEYDQLRLQRNLGNVFAGYMEGRISFKPTYKFDPGTDVWDTSDKQRDPSWTDRILYRGEHLQLTQYRSHWELKMSDHKPVSGLFEAGIKVMKSREEKMAEEIHDIKAEMNSLKQLLGSVNEKLELAMAKKHIAASDQETKSTQTDPGPSGESIWSKITGKM